MKAQRAMLALVFAAALTVVLLVWHASASSDAGTTVRGTVYYSTTPVPGVRVELITGTVTNLPAYATTTDSTGVYTFTQVPAGDYFIKFYGPTSDYMYAIYEYLQASGDVVVRDLYLVKLFDAILPPPASQVESLSPLFCWEGLPEAVRYELQLNRKSDWYLVEQNPNIRDTCYGTWKTLQNGVKYSWGVGAVDANGHYVGDSRGDLVFTVNVTPVVATSPQGGPVAINSPDGQIQVSFPGGFPAPAVVTYTRAGSPLVTGHLAGVDRAFYLTATDLLSGFPTTPIPPTNVTVHYRDPEARSVISNTLKLYRQEGPNGHRRASSTALRLPATARSEPLWITSPCSPFWALRASCSCRWSCGDREKEYMH